MQTMFISFQIENIPFVEMASKIIDGYNKNEVKIVNKTQKNEGFLKNSLIYSVNCIL